MYTEEYEERGFPIRSLIIKLLIIIIVILLLIWLLPKFIKPKNTKVVQVEGNKVKEEEVYQNNVDSMKNAAFKYYNETNLPKDEGKYKQVTLKELIDEDYIDALKDNNGKKINQTKSYIKITKVEDNEYILKINIKDSEIEDYELMTVGHYNYCTDYLCAKKEETEEEKKEKEQEIADTKVKAAIDKEENEYVPPVIVDNTFKYTKTIPAKLTDWTSWTSWKTINCNTIQNITCDTNNSKCLKEIKTTNNNGSCFESHRIRKVLVSSYTITRYSTENNQELLNDGWIYVGK